jgi:hypothetical protein
MAVADDSQCAIASISKAGSLLDADHSVCRHVVHVGMERHDDYRQPAFMALSNSNYGIWYGDFHCSADHVRELYIRSFQGGSIVRVQDLTSGDVFQNPEVEGEKGWGTFIAKDWHPVYRGLMLVVWHLAWEEDSRVWSFDALSPLQVLYDVEQVALTTKQRAANMRKVLGLK